MWEPALDVRPSTRSSYLRNLRLHVVPTIGHLRLQAIESPSLNLPYRELSKTGGKDEKEGGLSPRTVTSVADPLALSPITGTSPELITEIPHL